MKQTFIGLLAIIAIGFAFIACDNGNGKDTHTHDWQWVVTQAPTVTAEGIETETCSTCGETRGTRPIPKQEIKREFEFTLLDKKVFVKDSRTDATDKSLEELGIIAKLEVAADIIDGNTTVDKAAFNRVLAKGLIIIVEKPEEVLYNEYRSNGDGKTILFNIDYIGKTSTTANNMASRLNQTIANGLDKGWEFKI